MLDVCCYTGGFALQALCLGKALEATGIDLDESAIELARENARLNNVRPQFVQADAFGYLRDMIANGRQYDVVVLEPPKWIRNRRDQQDGERAYLDLNRLAMQLVAPGGLLLSCSCSGLQREQQFMDLLFQAARQAGSASPRADGRTGRTIQFLGRSGAAADHPVVPECPETEYLKAVWMCVN